MILTGHDLLPTDQELSRMDEPMFRKTVADYLRGITEEVKMRLLEIGPEDIDDDFRRLLDGLRRDINNGTGGTNVTLAKLLKAKAMQAGDDLNDYKVPGVYYAAGEAAGTIVHRPREGGNTVFVFAESTSQRVTQLWVLNGTTPVLCWRNCGTSGTWTEWIQMNSAADIIGTLPLSKGGTGATTAKGALSNFMDMTILQSGDTWGDCKTPGVYAAAGAVANAIPDRPRDGGCTVFVLANSDDQRATQLWVLNGSSPVWYMRNCNTNDVWTDWVSLNDPTYIFSAAPTISSITGYSGRADFTGGYVQYGRLVIVNTTLNVTATLGANANTVVATGMPRPAWGIVGLASCVVDAKRTAAPVGVTVSVGGNLSLDRSGQLVTGDKVYISGIYFAA